MDFIRYHYILAVLGNFGLQTHHNALCTNKMIYHNVFMTHSINWADFRYFFPNVSKATYVAYPLHSNRSAHFKYLCLRIRKCAREIWIYCVLFDQPDQSAACNVNHSVELHRKRNRQNKSCAQLFRCLKRFASSQNVQLLWLTSLWCIDIILVCVN